MRTTLALAIVVVPAALALAGCGGTSGSVAACKAALMTDYAHAKASPAAPAATEPAACKGLSHAQITTVIGQVVSAQFPSAGPGPSPSPVFTDPNGTVCPSPEPGSPGFGSGVCPSGQ